MPDLRDRITIDPAIYHGKPGIREPRYAVESLLELLSGGTKVDELLADSRPRARGHPRGIRLSHAA